MENKICKFFRVMDMVMARLLDYGLTVAVLVLLYKLVV